MKKDRKLLTYSKKQIETPVLKVMTKNQKNVIFKRRRLTILFSVALVMFGLMGFNLFSNSQHLTKLQKNYDEVVKEQKEVEKNEKNLEREVSLLNDSEYVEKIARAKYFYSKEGEQVYRIPDLNGTTQSTDNK